MDAWKLQRIRVHRVHRVHRVAKAAKAVQPAPLCWRRQGLDKCTCCGAFWRPCGVRVECGMKTFWYILLFIEFYWFIFESDRFLLKMNWTWLDQLNDLDDLDWCGQQRWIMGLWVVLACGCQASADVRTTDETLVWYHWSKPVEACCEPVEALHSHISHFVQKLACHCYCDEYSQPDFLFTFYLDVVVVDQEVCMDVCV